MYEVLHFVRLAGALVVGQKAHLWKDAVKAYGIGGVECRETAAQQFAECRCAACRLCAEPRSSTTWSAGVCAVR